MARHLQGEGRGGESGGHLVGLLLIVCEAVTCEQLGHADFVAAAAGNDGAVALLQAGILRNRHRPHRTTQAGISVRRLQIESYQPNESSWQCRVRTSCSVVVFGCRLIWDLNTKPESGLASNLEERLLWFRGSFVVVIWPLVGRAGSHLQCSYCRVGPCTSMNVTLSLSCAGAGGCDDNHI